MLLFFQVKGMRDDEEGEMRSEQMNWREEGRRRGGEGRREERGG